MSCLIWNNMYTFCKGTIIWTAGISVKKNGLWSKLLKELNRKAMNKN